MGDAMMRVLNTISELIPKKSKIKRKWSPRHAKK